MCSPCKLLKQIPQSHKLMQPCLEFLLIKFSIRNDSYYVNASFDLGTWGFCSKITHLLFQVASHNTFGRNQYLWKISREQKRFFFSPIKKKTVCFMMNIINVLLTYDGSLNFKSVNKVFLILILLTILLSFLLLAF